MTVHDFFLHRVIDLKQFDPRSIVIVSYALPSIAKEFQLTPQQVGLIGSSALAGMGIGSFCFTP